MLRAMKNTQILKISDNNRIALRFLSKEILSSLMQEEPLYKTKKKTYNLLNLINNIS